MLDGRIKADTDVGPGSIAKKGPLVASKCQHSIFGPLDPVMHVLMDQKSGSGRSSVHRDRRQIRWHRSDMDV